ncbi:DUF5345 family protein [Acetivibrio cellulolyticus]|uniref:DUF5345 family protein n=1 Tax=Acetivibrio cellulolyticus TaxID=35830 RepID=UPI0001E2EB75|nr:DUF5345 family protein [Acetivibrio cellulolyticus]
MMGNEDEKIIQEMKDTLNYVDDNLPVNKPGIGNFKLLVSQVEEKKRYWKNIELLVFLIVAVTVLSVSSGILFLNITLFMSLQAAAFVTIPISVLVWFKHHFGRVNN